ncbi:hypothetical protein HOP50_03g22310 [Chloropicon primus]|nr:hypothetical protein A3770_03p22320 [Chloropicon primus]UPQ98925.1 hypothetical protein HOP50_03g22310 [Chloropicon primus]|eukprot:QDZ19714.1 hypothetical protein A3770_03p22320 [Chloropicon primus]
MIASKKFAAVLAVVALANAVEAARTLTQEIRETKTGLLWKGSPLFAASDAAKAGFTCGYEGRECNFQYSDQTGPDGTCVPAAAPYIPTNPNPTMMEFCGYHQANPPYHWDGVWHNTTLLSESIPSGAFYGCIVGNNWQSQEARRLPGWMGKAFNANTGGFANLVDVGFYSDNTAYPGRFYPTYSVEGGLSWTLDYQVQTGVPLIGGVLDFAINRLLPGQYIRNFGGFKDEIKEIAPGVWLGRVYSLPMSLSWDLSLGNVSPFTVYTQVPFLLFQACL